MIFLTSHKVTDVSNINSTILELILYKDSINDNFHSVEELASLLQVTEVTLKKYFKSLVISLTFDNNNKVFENPKADIVKKALDHYAYFYQKKSPKPKEVSDRWNGLQREERLEKVKEILKEKPYITMGELSNNMNISIVTAKRYVLEIKENQK